MWKAISSVAMSQRTQLLLLTLKFFLLRMFLVFSLSKRRTHKKTSSLIWHLDFQIQMKGAGG
uniref:Uncharacterized protein n=1 Tax=Arundo donax TaxID=35708 RepID=A0A0A9C333_ARUDO